MSEREHNHPDPVWLIKYRQEFCQMLIEHMAEGYSFESFGAIVRAGRTTMYGWVDKYPEFKEAKEVATAMGVKFLETALQSHTMSESYDDKVLQRSFDPKKINTQTIQWILSTRHRDLYSGKTTVVHEGGLNNTTTTKHDLSNLSVEELKTLMAIQDKIEKPTDT